MRILLVAPTLPYLPCHADGRRLAARLLAELARRHEVGVVAAVDRGETPRARPWAAAHAAFVTTVPAERPRRAWTRPPGATLDALRAAVGAAIDRFAPDVLHLSGAGLAPLRRLGAVPSVLSCAEAAPRAPGVARRPWARLRARLDAQAAERWLSSVDACVVAGDDDRAALAGSLPLARVERIAPGIDPRQYEYRRAGEPGRIVFTGAFASPADAAAARRLVTGILPRVRREQPRADVVLAGPDAATGVRALGAVAGVRIAGLTPDVRPTLWRAAVYVNPGGPGFGATCRLLEALATGAPVVASRRALSGLPDVLPDRHVLVADTDDAFAQAVLALMREPALADGLARNARALVEAGYAWAMIAARYEAVYARVAGATTPVAAAA